MWYLVLLVRLALLEVMTLQTLAYAVLVAHVVPLVHMALVVHVVRACGAAVQFRRIQSSSGAFS